MKLISIIKPGIIVGNLVTLCGGYFLAIHHHFSILHFLATVIGMISVIACGCILNNCVDRDIDRLMQRTQQRPLACGLISVKLAIGYAIVFGLVGISAFYLGTNILTLSIALIGLFTYVVAYTIWLKRRNVFGTIIGAISGAVPPVIGYTAVTNQIDMVALALLLILFCWQIPHFFAIAICYQDDYANAQIPVVPLTRSMLYTKVNMLLFVALFFAASLLLPVLGAVGITYLITATVIGIAWIIISVRGFFVDDDLKWARQMFLASIMGITVLAIGMAV